MPPFWSNIDTEDVQFIITQGYFTFPHRVLVSQWVDAPVMARANEIQSDSLNASDLAAQLKGRALALVVFNIVHPAAPAVGLFLIAAKGTAQLLNAPGRGTPAKACTLGAVPLINEPNKATFSIARNGIADEAAARVTNEALVTESCTFTHVHGGKHPT